MIESSVDKRNVQVVHSDGMPGLWRCLFSSKLEGGEDVAMSTREDTGQQ